MGLEDRKVRALEDLNRSVKEIVKAFSALSANLVALSRKIAESERDDKEIVPSDYVSVEGYSGGMESVTRSNEPPGNPPYHI